MIIFVICKWSLQSLVKFRKRLEIEINVKEMLQILKLKCNFYCFVRIRLLLPRFTGKTSDFPLLLFRRRSLIYFIDYMCLNKVKNFFVSQAIKQSETMILISNYFLSVSLFQENYLSPLEFNLRCTLAYIPSYFCLRRKDMMWLILKGFHWYN